MLIRRLVQKGYFEVFALQHEAANSTGFDYDDAGSVDVLVLQEA